jgi:hypothetical protein
LHPFSTALSTARGAPIFPKARRAARAGFPRHCNKHAYVFSPRVRAKVRYFPQKIAPKDFVCRARQCAQKSLERFLGF